MHRTRRNRRPESRTHQQRWAAVSLVLLLAATASDAQETGTETFSETVHVRIVNVDVYVAGKGGRPIEGLTAADFLVYEDGTLVEISNFYSGGSPRTADYASEQTEPEGDETPVPIEESGEESVGESKTEQPPVWAVVYVDNSALEPGHRSRILEDLRTFTAARVGEEVRFLLATRDLALNVGSFTTDAAEFVRKLDGLGKGSGRGIDEVLAYRSFMNTVRSLIDAYKGAAGATLACPDPCDCAWEQMVSAWDLYAQSATHRVGVTARGLSELVSSLGGLPGRKAVFYISSGLQQRPGISLLNYLADVCPQYQRDIVQYTLRYDATDRLEELAAHANAGRVTLYPVDAAGLRPDMGSSVDFADFDYRPSSLTSRMRTANLQASLQILAEHTGGRVILNTNRVLKSLEEVSGDFENFYSLGFRPSHPADGETHRIRVELREKRRGVKIRFRRSYRDKVLGEKLGERVLSAFLIDEPSNPLTIRARAGRVEHLSGKEYSVPVEILIPADSLVQLGPSARSRIRLVLTAEDAKGRHSPPRQKFVELERPEEGGDHSFVVNLRLRAGHHRIALGVRDEIGAGESFARLEVEVGGEIGAAKAVQPAPEAPA